MPDAGFFDQRPDPAVMLERGLNTEHHAVPGQYVSFLYNQGGSMVKWFRNTFAAAEHQQARATGQDVIPGAAVRNARGAKPGDGAAAF